MSKPKLKPIDPADLPRIAREVMAADPFPHLATVGVIESGEGAGQAKPSVRPVSPVRTDGFTVYVANLRSYTKTAEIAANPNVELCYLDQNHDQVRISGIAEIVTDRAILQEIWDHNPLLRQYLGSLDNPELIIYCIRPVRVRYMQEWALEYHEVLAGE